VTTMQIDAGLDTGDMLRKWETEIGPEEDALELGTRLAGAGADLLVETLRENPIPQKQNPDQATYAPILKKEDGEIDWNWPAAMVHNRTRGLLPWPGSYSFFRGQLFHIWKSRVALDARVAVAGRMISEKKRLLVGCGEGTTLEAIEVQVEGRKRMAAEAFLIGQHMREDELLGGKAA
jgi:methionyl-tRNA formyltransferase